MSQIVQMVTTVGSQADAERLARFLVEQRLAACVQIDGPLTSIYHWQGRIESSEEWRLTAKSLKSHSGRLEAVVRERHPYEVPEILTTEISTVSEAYRMWLESEVGAAG